MINYLEKFNKLPDIIKQAISSEDAMAAIAEIENTYDINLATVVMRVVVKDISILDLPKFFVFEHEMDGKRAEELAEELKEKVFYTIADYLGFEASRKAPSELEMRIKSEIKGDIKKASSSSFFFSSEDEEEVSELAKKVEGFVSKEDLNKQKEELTRQMDHRLRIILNQLTIQFSSEDMTNRFKYVISSYLRGIRNKIDTREVLKKDIENGGLGLDDILVDRALNIVDKVSKEEVKPEDVPKAPAKISVPEDRAVAEDAKTQVAGGDKDIYVNDKKNDDKDELKKELKLSGVRDMEYDFSKFAGAKDKEGEKPKIEVDVPIEKINIENDNSEEEKEDKDSAIIDLSSKEKLDTIINDAVVKPVQADGATSGKKLRLEDVFSDSEPSVSAPGNEKDQIDKINIVNVRKPSDDGGRKRMEDVKYVPKLTGPLDELKEMTLVDFRRLSHEPSVSANKISEKITFLEEESYSQRLAGIKAWRQSPVNKLYLEIGQQSINEKIGVDQVINSRRNEGSEFLSNDEFAAIMDLNKELRF